MKPENEQAMLEVVRCARAVLPIADNGMKRAIACSDEHDEAFDALRDALAKLDECNP